jgi:hypothetical protein
MTTSPSGEERRPGEVVGNGRREAPGAPVGGRPSREAGQVVNIHHLKREVMEVVSSFDWMIWKSILAKAARWEGVRGNHSPLTGAKRRGAPPGSDECAALGALIAAAVHVRRLERPGTSAEHGAGCSRQRRGDVRNGAAPLEGKGSCRAKDGCAGTAAQTRLH